MSAARVENKIGEVIGRLTRGQASGQDWFKQLPDMDQKLLSDEWEWNLLNIRNGFTLALYDPRSGGVSLDFIKGQENPIGTKFKTDENGNLVTEGSITFMQGIKPEKDGVRMPGGTKFFPEGGK
jgi:hypothetical protein